MTKQGSSVYQIPNVLQYGKMPDEFLYELNYTQIIFQILISITAFNFNTTCVNYLAIKPIICIASSFHFCMKIIFTPLETIALTLV